MQPAASWRSSAAQPAAERLPGSTIDIVTPTGGESVTEGTILEWAVKVGDQVKDGDTVVEISTDKVDMELPAPASGTITELLAEEGETVTVGEVIGRMTAGASTGAAARRPRPPAPNGERHRSDGGRADRRPGRPAGATPATGRRPPTPHPSPAASRQEGIDLDTVTGTARGGRITKSDVIAAGNGAAAAPAAPAAAPSRARS